MHEFRVGQCELKHWFYLHKMHLRLILKLHEKNAKNKCFSSRKLDSNPQVLLDWKHFTIMVTYRVELLYGTMNDPFLRDCPPLCAAIVSILPPKHPLWQILAKLQRSQERKHLKQESCGFACGDGDWEDSGVGRRWVRSWHRNRPACVAARPPGQSLGTASDDALPARRSTAASGLNNPPPRTHPPAQPASHIPLSKLEGNLRCAREQKTQISSPFQVHVCASLQEP